MQQDNLTRQEDLYALFKDMVDIYSPSGKEEEIVRYLSEYLDGTGLSVVLRSVDETRHNLEISAKRADPDTLFLGHIDTVSAYDIEEYAFSDENGICRGLGTADMKGGCAALLHSFILAAEGGFLPKNVLLSLVVGEEESGDGTKALLEEYRFNQALVAEPTGLLPCSSHYGYLELIISIFGYRRHAAMSNMDTHSIRTMLRLLLQLEKEIDGLDEDTVLNIRDLHSSESGFAAPDRCSTSIDLHFPPETDVTEQAKRLESFIHSYLNKSQVTDFELELPFVSGGYILPNNNDFLENIRSVYKLQNRPWQYSAFKSHSDANLLRDAGCSPIILGPGYLEAAHTRDEYVEFSQVKEASSIYTELLRQLYRGYSKSPLSS